MPDTSALLSPRVARADEVTPLSAFGDSVWPLISSADSGGELEFVSMESPAGNGPPFHVHTQEDEIFIVQRGRVEWTANGQTFEGGAGTVVFAPRHVPHTFRATDDGPAAMYLVTAPGNFGRFFARCTECFTAAGPDVEKITAVAGEHGIYFMPPEAAADYQSPVPVQAPIRVLSGEGEFLEHGGYTVRFVLTAADTGGLYGMVELSAPPGGGPPLHTHTHEDELFIVMQGEYEFQLQDRTVRATPGTIIFAPRPQPHSFRVVGNKPGRILVLIRPGGFEDYFRHVFNAMKEISPSPERFAQIGREFGIVPANA